MKTTVLNKSQLFILKAFIKGLAEEGSRTRRFINKSVKERKDYYWNQKRNIGEEARYHLIAYGLLRGISYEKIEPNSNKEWMKYNFDFKHLSNIMLKHTMHVYFSNHVFFPNRAALCPENLERLILTEVTAKQEVA